MTGQRTEDRLRPARSAPLVLLAGGIGLLTSLYLPWRSATCAPDELPQGQTTCALLNVFSGEGIANGISSEVGRAAALFALALVVLAAAGWIRPDLAGRLPLARAALLAGYFGLAVGLHARSGVSPQGFDTHYAYGAYIGTAAVMIVLLAAFVSSREQLAGYRSPARMAMLVLVVGLAGAFLLPWWELSLGPTEIRDIGLAGPPATLAAALALCLPAFWAQRLGLAVATALFTLGAAVSLSPFADHEYGVLVALGIAGALVALALPAVPRTFDLARLSWLQLLAAAAAVLFLGALFLPWQKWCYGVGPEFGSLAGRCVSTNAWTTAIGAAAAALAIALLVAALRPDRLPVVELAGGFGVLAATLGFQLEETAGAGVRGEWGYGAVIGLAAAALIALLFAPLRPQSFDPRRGLARAVPIAACVGYLAVVVLPWWDVLPDGVQSSLAFAPAFWPTIVGALLGIRLLGLWVRQIAGSAAGVELALLPIAMLALAVVDHVAPGGDAIAWGGGAVVVLCLGLALLGGIEQRRGLENFRLPEALRVDRL